MSVRIGALRIGAVSYLNSKPLIERLDQFAPAATLVLDFPSRLADQLAQRELDVALIPSVEVLLDPDYQIVSDACVATRGEVLSVKLFSRVPPGQIDRLALDMGSRTSAALVRILLAERFGVTPRIERLPMTSNTEDTDADAILLIGDRAIHPPSEQFHTVWDLGAEWTQWTNLPFVFAMWAARADTDLQCVDLALVAARDLGERWLSNIARREAPGLGISETTAYDYLTKNLHYRIGPDELRALRLFHELAVKHGFAPGGNELVFRHFAAAREGRRRRATDPGRRVADS